MTTRSVILAGGEGRRLRPHTDSVPKPLLPLAGRPVLEILIEQLRGHGFGRIDLCVGHRADAIRAHFGDGTPMGVEITYHDDVRMLGTIGPLRAIGGIQADETLLVVNADILADIDFGAVVDGHHRSGAAATVCVKRHDLACEFGVVEMGDDDDLSAFVEKPTVPVNISIGVNVIQGDSLGLIAVDEHIGVPDFMMRLRASGGRVRCHAVHGAWFDIGRIEDYRAAETALAQNPERFLVNGRGPLTGATRSSGTSL